MDRNDRLAASATDNQVRSALPDLFTSEAPEERPQFSRPHFCSLPGRRLCV
jgi:hypothetical protein